MMDWLRTTSARIAAIASRPTAVTLAVALTISGASTDAEAAKKRAGDNALPVTVVVDLARQRAVAYRGTKAVFSSRVSSGKAGHRTPTGVFSIIQKRRRHFSNLYNNAPMPHMQRLTWSGIALHGGPVPRYPASHGCVRFPFGNARRLFGLTRMNARVIVTRGAPRPTLISHKALWNRLPPGAPPAELEPNLETANAEVATPVRRTTKAGDVLTAVMGISEARASSTRTMISARLSAATVADVPQRTRAAVLAREARRIEGLKMVQDGARQRLRLAETLLKGRAQRYRQLGRDLIGARRAERRATAHLARWKRRNAAAERKLSRFLVARVSVLADDPNFDKLAGRETKLEDTVSDASSEFAFAEDTLGETKRVRTAIEVKHAALRDQTAEARKTLRSARAAYQKASQAVKSRQQALDLMDRPVHVLISRQTEKLYVRQGYQPIFEADVGFKDADAALGTHVFTAVSEDEPTGALRWTAVTVPDRKFKAPVVGKRKGRPVRRFDARTALDRVVMPVAARERVEELMKVGSSVIVSDRGPSHETGKGTDFVILTR
ncbi:MAG: L,D-transpeptidase family protein [Pseudomonadota bacterium]